VLIASVCSIPATAQDVPQRLYMPVVFTSYPPSLFAVETPFSGMIADRSVGFSVVFIERTL
jgi:hypothetical protein